MPPPPRKLAFGGLSVVAALVIVGGAGTAGAPRLEDPGEERAPGAPRHSSEFEFVSDEPGATFECRLDGGAWQVCDSPESYGDVGRGPHSFEVRATDMAGNVDATPAGHGWTDGTGAKDDAKPARPPATPSQATETTETTPPESTSTVPPEMDDGAPPETTVDSGPSGYVAAGTASFAFGAGEPATFECRLDGGAWEACVPPKQYAGLADGAHSFEVRATDAAGNTDETPARRDWTVDTDPPETTITRAPAGPDAPQAAEKPRPSGDRAPWGTRCRERVRPAVVARRVERIRGIDLSAPGIEIGSAARVQVVSRARFRRELEIADAGQARLASMLHLPPGDVTVRAHAYRAFARIAGVREKLRGVGGHGWGLAAAELYDRAPRVPGTGAVYDSTRNLVVADRRAEGCAAEYALAHELTRAFEERWRPEGWEGAPLPEAWLTDRAVDEGLASAVAARYAVRYLGAGSVSDVLAWQRRLVERGSSSAPIQESRAFVFRDGPRFMESLIKRAGLVGGPQNAYTLPPSTSAEIMHPNAPRGDLAHYADPGDVPAWMSPLEKHAGGRWDYTQPGNIEIGELDTVVLLRAGLPRRQARRAAARTYGGTFLVLHCTTRCRGDSAAVVAWAWRNPAKAREFAAAVTRFLATVSAGPAAVAVEGCITGLAFAPTELSAAKLARAPIEGPAIPPGPCEPAPG